MKAVIVQGINNLVVKDIPVPDILHGTALVKVHYGGLCEPMDDAILRGLHPRARFPLVLCHEFSGEIADIAYTNSNGDNNRNTGPFLAEVNSERKTCKKMSLTT